MFPPQLSPAWRGRGIHSRRWRRSIPSLQLHLCYSLLTSDDNSHDAEDGAVIRNIEACQAISQTVQTSLGPYGRNKIVINHLQKMILTSDAATILRELDVVHPAAKLLVMASQQQDAEMGDGTNLVIILATHVVSAITAIYLDGRQVFFDPNSKNGRTQCPDGSYFGGWRRRNALKMWTGWPTFPMVFVKGALVGGASDLQRLIDSGELKRLLGE